MKGIKINKLTVVSKTKELGINMFDEEEHYDSPLSQEEKQSLFKGHFLEEKELIEPKVFMAEIILTEEFEVIEREVYGDTIEELKQELNKENKKIMTYSLTDLEISFSIREDVMGILGKDMMLIYSTTLTATNNMLRNRSFHVGLEKLEEEYEKALKRREGI